MIYHITTADRWEAAQKLGVYRADSLQSQGFIHCSDAQQVVRVANALFARKQGLTLLHIDPRKLKANVVYENLDGGTEDFPHVYGPIDLEAVVKVTSFRPNPDGNFDHFRITLALSEFKPIETERLWLRPYRPSDAPFIQKLAGEREVAKTLSNVPHPYEDGMAEAWIDMALEALAQARSLHLAIALKKEFSGDYAEGHAGGQSEPGAAGDDLFIGSIGLEISFWSNSAEIGYWLGLPYWNKGYMTEAARAMLTYGFETLGLNRIEARHMTNNPASGRVMQKIGMTYEGTARQATQRFGEYHDLALYSILRSEYEAAKTAAS